jgi:hypothetical protein
MKVATLRLLTTFGVGIGFLVAGAIATGAVQR